MMMEIDDERPAAAVVRTYSSPQPDEPPAEWEKVLDGTMTPDEAAQERERQGDSPEQIALDRELYQPMSPARRDAILARVLKPEPDR